MNYKPDQYGFQEASEILTAIGKTGPWEIPSYSDIAEADPKGPNDKLDKSGTFWSRKGIPVSTPIYDDVAKDVTTGATGEPTAKPTAKVLAGAVTGLALTVVVAVLTAITPDLLAPLGAWAGPAFAGIGALAVALGAYIKKPTGDVN